MSDQNLSELLRAAMRDAGISYSGPIERDGKRHRITPDDHDKPTAWYKFHTDDPPAANYGDWRITGEAGLNWSVAPTRKLSPEELEAQKRENARRRKEEQRENEEKHRMAEKKASDILSVSAQKPSDAEYMLRKGIQPHSAVRYQGETHWFENINCKPFPITKGDVFIRVVKDGKVVGLQRLDADGTKMFLPGTDKKGAYCHLGPKPDGVEGSQIIICEGFATGASIVEATGLPVFVAFDTGNLKPVAKRLKERNPEAILIIAADDDRFTENNPGIRYASEAAAETGAIVRRPIFKPNTEGKPTDFNDLAAIDGLAEVAYQITHGKPSYPMAELVAAKHAEVLEKEIKPIVIHVATEPPPPSELIARYEALGLALTMNGQPICNTDNILRVLTNFKTFKDFLWLDEFHMKVFTNWSGEVREWTDADTVDLMVIFQREFGMRGTKRTHVQEAIESIAKKNRKNEPKDWLSTLKWDGNPRIDHFFTEAMGVIDNEYTQAASRNFWIGLAARILLPGCKLDTMVILEGGQGKYKSTALSVIGGKWFTESNANPSNKDFYMVMQGNLIVEIAELDSFSRAEVNTIKNILSTRKDRYRPPYGRSAMDFPRQSIFVGTTNEDEYLRDSTGGRRFWPMRVGNIDLKLIEEHREQLFAEAAARFKLGETWWEMPVSAKSEQEARRQQDPWEEIIAKWADGRDDVSATQIALDCLKMDEGHITHSHTIRIGKILRMLGFTRGNALDRSKTKRFVRIKV